MAGRGTDRVLRPPAPAHRVLDARRRGPGRTTSSRPRSPTASRRSRSPTTGTCTASSTSTRRAATQGITPIIGTEAYMAANSRFERPVRRGRVDDTGGEGERGEKLYYHLTLLAETTTGYRNLMKLSSAAYLEGYYYKPRARLGAARAPPRGPHRDDRLPRRRGARRRCSDDDVDEATRARRRACRTSSGATTSSSSCRTTAWPSSGGRTRCSSRSPRRSARRSSRRTTATTAAARTPSPTTRCCACRPARRSTIRSGSSSTARSTT